ncbi:hypothetical protein M9458_019159, partial [Cirrhinus mrigala]
MARRSVLRDSSRDQQNTEHRVLEERADHRPSGLDTGRVHRELHLATADAPAD